MNRTSFAATLVVVIQATQLTTQLKDLKMDQLNFAQKGPEFDGVANGVDKAVLCQTNKTKIPHHGLAQRGPEFDGVANGDDKADPCQTNET